MAIPKKENPLKTILIYLAIIVLILVFGKYIFQIEVNEEGKLEFEDKKGKEIEKICLDKQLPENFYSKIKNFGTEEEIKVEKGYIGEECSVVINRNTLEIADHERLWTEMFVLVTKHNSNTEGISSENIEEAVKNAEYKDKNLVWGSKTEKFLKSKFDIGVGYPKYTEEEIKEKVMQGETMAIIPFENILPGYKVIPISNRTPLSKNINELAYTLSDSFYISKKENPIRENLTEYIKEELSENKYQKDKISTIITTGASKIGATGLYETLKEKGAKNIISPLTNILKEADITHISNKTTISRNCIQEEDADDLCSPPEIIEVLNHAGVDIVGMTGNHIIDYGGDDFRNTLDIYTENDIKYFGAGRTLQDAHRPRILEMGNLKIAFLGYTNVPPEIYWSNENRGGNATLSKSNLERYISVAKEKADYVFVEMQWHEDKEDFGKAAIEYGADIVIGVHSNEKENIQHYKEGIIFYELGSFLTSNAEGILIKHMFYKDNYLGYNVIPTYMSDKMQTTVDKQYEAEFDESF